jgi:hypothetical protein
MDLISKYAFGDVGGGEEKEESNWIWKAEGEEGLKAQSWKLKVGDRG